MTQAKKPVAIALVALGAAAAFMLGSRADADSSTSAGHAILVDTAGSAVGKVKLISAGTRVEAFVEASGLTPGFHGFHVHAVGRCEAPFTSAGGHYNPGSAGHREHAGDLPILLVNRDGTAKASFTTDRLTVAQLFDADGSAIVVHADPDNYAHIPARYSATGPDATTLATGDAGGRVACGVVLPGSAGDEERGRGR